MTFTDTIFALSSGRRKAFVECRDGSGHTRLCLLERDAGRKTRHGAERVGLIRGRGIELKRNE